MMTRIFIALAIVATPLAAHAGSGASVYQRCAACHLPSRAGVPGAFPALTQEPARLAGSKEGRRYLILAVANGVAGPISSAGRAYRGVMPAQALSDADIADVLNFLIASGAKKPAAFTAAEVKSVRAAAKSVPAAQVGRLRPK